MLLQQLQLHNVESFMDNLWQEYQIHIQEGKNYQQKQKKVDKFIFFLSTGYSLLRAESFSCSLDFLYGK